MSNNLEQEILERSIKKAIDGGWTVDTERSVKPTVKDALYWYEVGSLSTNFDNYKQFIFNHDFAKAIWGEESHTLKFPEGEIDMQSPLWQYHLQQMVISDDPIAYLGDHLDD